MPAYRKIYEAAGWWNEHFGRIKTLAFVLLALAAATLLGGGFLVHRYGLVGGIAIFVGAILFVVAVAGFALDRKLDAGRAPAVVPDAGAPPPSRRGGAWYGEAMKAWSGELLTGIVSRDPRVKVTYTADHEQDPNLRVGFYYPRDANKNGEIELELGRNRPVEWRVQLTNNLPQDVPRVHVTILLPDALTHEVSPLGGLDFAEDHFPGEQMLSDSRGSVRLQGWVGPIVGRGYVNEIPFHISVGFAREMPVRVMVTSDATGNVSYYGRIVGVMAAEAQAQGDPVEPLAAMSAVERIGLIGTMSGFIDRGSDLIAIEYRRPDRTLPSPQGAQELNQWREEIRAEVAPWPEINDNLYRIKGPISAFSTAEEVIAAANDTIPGLKVIKRQLEEM